jgi:hypothetical protein
VKLLNAANAFIDQAKLVTYLLPVGRHKARLFLRFDFRLDRVGPILIDPTVAQARNSGYLL